MKLLQTVSLNHLIEGSAYIICDISDGEFKRLSLFIFHHKVSIYPSIRSYGDSIFDILYQDGHISYAKCLWDYNEYLHRGERENEVLIFKLDNDEFMKHITAELI